MSEQRSDVLDPQVMRDLAQEREGEAPAVATGDYQPSQHVQESQFEVDDNDVQQGPMSRDLLDLPNEIDTGDGDGDDDNDDIGGNIYDQNAAELRAESEGVFDADPDGYVRSETSSAVERLGETGPVVSFSERVEVAGRKHELDDAAEQGPPKRRIVTQTVTTQQIIPESQLPASGAMLAPPQPSAIASDVVGSVGSALLLAQQRMASATNEILSCLPSPGVDTASIATQPSLTPPPSSIVSSSPDSMALPTPSSLDGSTSNTATNAATTASHPGVVDLREFTGTPVSRDFSVPIDDKSKPEGIVTGTLASVDEMGEHGGEDVAGGKGGERDGEEEERRLPELSDGELADMRKKDLVKLLQEHAPQDFKVSHHITGQPQNVAKRLRQNELIGLYHELQTSLS